MRVFLLIAGGFVTTLATFAFGVLFAVQLLTAEPPRDPSSGIDVTELWTTDAVPVIAPDKNFERLPPLQSKVPQQTETVANDAEGASTAGETVDTISTASVASDGLPATATPVVLNVAHVEWCSSRYRSYQPADNSYTSYRGGKRECISPFFEGATEEADIYASSDSDTPYVGYAIDDGPPANFLSPEHVRSCFNRYRSYRPEDNSYQPYGGGPRRQCW